MRRPTRRGVRAALDASAIPTFSGPRGAAASAEAIQFVRAPGWLPRGHRVYAIGDIHGCKTQLELLHAEIVRDLAARPVASPLLVHLGDYIDNGPDSAGVIELLASRAPKVPAIHLLGDHERMLLDALDGDRAAATRSSVIPISRGRRPAPSSTKSRRMTSPAPGSSRLPAGQS